MNKTATVHKRSSQDECVSLMGVRFDALDEGQVIQRVIDGLALGQGGWVITSDRPAHILGTGMPMWV